MKIHSLSRFLNIALLLSIGITIGTVSFISYLEAKHEVEELYDAELAQSARTLQSLLRNQLQRTELGQNLVYQPPKFPAGSEEDEETPVGHKYEKKLFFVVWNQSGEILLENTTDVHFSLVPERGYKTELQDDHYWRSFQLFDSQLKAWIKVAQRDDVHNELTQEIAENTIYPLLLLMPVLAFIITFVIKKGLKPLKELSAEIESRDSDHLQPLVINNSPEELHTVVNSINQLMELLDSALKRERDFTADAAHELKTPLAAIRIHTQNLGNYLRDTHEQNTKPQQTLKNIVSGVDRMTHVVNQLLTLMRVQQSPAAKQPIDLAEIAEKVVKDLSPLAADKQQTINYASTKSVMLLGDPIAADNLCRNLIENAIRYTQNHGVIHVSITHRNNMLCLQVEDNGPGIPDEEKEKVFDRFYRMQQQAIEGSGLGLAIAREIAIQLGGSLELSDNPATGTGLVVSVCFAELEA